MLEERCELDGLVGLPSSWEGAMEASESCGPSLPLFSLGLQGKGETPGGGSSAGW